MNRFRISTPEGTRDLLFASCRALRQTERAVRDALESCGYSEVITPAVEYFDVFAQANPELDQENMLKIIDRSGRICVARPDNTTPIARIAATRLDDAALPVRLYYSQKVFRSVAGGHGHKGEFLQVGAELIGADGLEADKDILSAAFSALTGTGADNFRIELGHAEIYKALIEELSVGGQTAESIRRLIENKSFAALGDALAPYGDRPAAKALRAMPQLFGGMEVLDEVERLLVGKNVWIDTSLAVPFGMDDEQFRRILTNHLPDHILFGSDYPWFLPEDTYRRIIGLGLPNELLEGIFYKNALALLGDDTNK